MLPVARYAGKLLYCVYMSVVSLALVFLVRCRSRVFAVWDTREFLSEGDDLPRSRWQKRFSQNLLGGLVRS